MQKTNAKYRSLNLAKPIVHFCFPFKILYHCFDYCEHKFIKKQSKGKAPNRSGESLLVPPLRYGTSETLA